jgi:hypothetical protein
VPRLTWNIFALINIKVFLVTRDCGEDRNMLQTPGCAYLNAATDVKDTARIKAQSLPKGVVTRDCGGFHDTGLLPRVPCHTIANDSATAELLRNLSERHIEVASQELNAKTCHILRKSIPEGSPCLWPFYLHGAVIPMRSAHHDIFPKMANVLFEVNSAHYHPRPRHFLFALLSVSVVIMNFVMEALQGSCVILASGNQNSGLLFASHHKVIACASPLQAFLVKVSLHWGLLQQVFYLSRGLQNNQHLRRALQDLAILDLASEFLCRLAAHCASQSPIAQEQPEVAHLRLAVILG